VRIGPVRKSRKCDHHMMAAAASYGQVCNFSVGCCRVFPPEFSAGEDTKAGLLLLLLRAPVWHTNDGSRCREPSHARMYAVQAVLCRPSWLSSPQAREGKGRKRSQQVPNRARDMRCSMKQNHTCRWSSCQKNISPRVIRILTSLGSTGPKVPMPKAS